MLHNATPHYDNGKYSSQPEVAQKSHICIKNQSCKPCSQSENCCPTISHYDTPFHYDSFSMLAGLSISYHQPKEHPYMSELALFPVYAAIAPVSHIAQKAGYHRHDDTLPLFFTNGSDLHCSCPVPPNRGGANGAPAGGAFLVDIPTEAVAVVRGPDELRLLIFPQPLDGALKNQNAAPASPPCFRRRRRSAPLLFESCTVLL